jgi:hypothetical protein
MIRLQEVKVNNIVDEYISKYVKVLQILGT